MRIFRSVFSAPIPASLTFLAAVCAAGCSSAPKKKELTQRERAELYLNVAQGALSEGDPTAALHALKAAEELDPSLPEIYHSRAIAFEAKRDLPRAVKDAKKAADLAPSSSAALNTYGKLLLDLGRNTEAVSPLMKAASDPYNAESFKAKTNLGILFYRQNDDARALQYLTQAIEAAPALSCHAHYYSGHVRLRQGRVNEAIRSYEKATLALCAQFADAHYALGIAYERGRRFDEARKVFVGIRSTFPNTQYAEKAMDRLREIP